MHVPRSGVSGILWPAVPKGRDAAVLALAYQLQETERLASDVIEKIQFRQIERLLAHAAATVPFYRDRLRPFAELKAGGLDRDLWRRIPILRRSEVQGAGEGLQSTSLPADHGGTGDVVTSGSTGRPVRLKSTAVTSLFFLATTLRYHRWHRRDFAAPVAAIRSLRGALLEASRQDKPVSWVPAHPSGPMYLFPSNRPSGEQLAWLTSKDPVYLLTQPSNLGALLRESQRTGVRFSRLRQVATLGETLDAELRRRCEEAWGVPVVDAYSAEEVGNIALQCPQQPHYHVQSESVYVEVLDQAGNPCPPGAAGRIVITDLHNFATPLIRYEIGDYAEVGARCGCGRGLPVLARILGRSRNMLVLPDGQFVWPNLPSEPLLAIAPVEQLQIVQKSAHDLEVRLVVSAPLAADQEERLAAYLAGQFHHRFRCRFVYATEIPRAPSGKFEMVISEIARP